MTENPVESESMQERRADPRVAVEVEVHYRTAQEFVAAYSLNISGGGIYIRTQEPLPLNQVVHLRFTLPGIARTFDLQGLVVWSTPYPSRSSFPPGMGIRFMALDPESRKIVATFVRGKVAAPAPEKEKETKSGDG